ncbi:MAG: cbb3-type cytochrome oxidase assembly protein CcoS [Phycisphaerae bacterium]|nr:cbb3-type cytochrome oxidase assembly protein CcoS [Phycisphaerae bacterium]MBM91068.1 cbb3-type cytochrome oxidase assembly protein CcoS [Phycisphaerae bacterium]HCT45603.1 cbb3-type cytochrome oxidase assembly protein CcoS [Phycisphaerales bacterium]|tara:strand:+ start:753 stop:986 length:234 start_codon:yes stop_codon:yes gene_type:complete
MSVILIMIPAAILLAGIGVWAFIVAAKRGQFDDLDTPAIRAVFDDDDVPSSTANGEIYAQSSTGSDAGDAGGDAHSV